ALLAAACVFGCSGGTSPAKPPDVVFIVIDTLRSDHLPLYGYDRATAPRLSEFARDAVTYERAISASTWTVPAHGSMFNGRWPSFHGAERLAGDHILATPIAGDVPTLGEILKRAGWTTAAFVANNAYVVPSLGFARGFDSFALDVAFADQVDAA